MAKKPKPKKAKLSLDQIMATSDTQVRKVDAKIVERYTEDLKDGAIFPPIIVFNEGGESQRWWLADGFHRLFAHRDADVPEIACEVHVGGLLEAQIYSYGANATHGFQRSRKDTTRAVELALQNPELAEFKQQDIADICGVTRRTVSRIKQRLVLEAAEKEANRGKVKPEPPTDADLRTSKPEPTQEEAEAEELRAAMKTIRAFPYGGEDSDKLPLDSNDIEEMEYCAGWLSHAVLVWRKG